MQTKKTVPLFSQFNDRALAYTERVRAGTQVKTWPHIWQGMPALKGAVGMREVWRQPIRRRRPQLFWTDAGVEGWLRQRERVTEEITYVVM